jgi:hypothetical protein
MTTTRIAFAAVLFVLLAAGAWQTKAQSGAPSPAESSAASFDPPVLQRVVNFAHLPRPQTHGRLTCSYYPAFMVKELDLGEEGAAWFAIVPSPPGRVPACTRKQGATEKLIRGRDWCGYFAGVKKDYVFLNACAAHNSGLDFAIYDARTGRRIFEDTAVDSMAGGVQFRQAADGRVLLTYARVAQFRCTLPAEKDACWRQIRGQLGLDRAAMPLCIAYEKQMTGTVVAYPVEVSLTAKPAIRAVPGQIHCWPPE